jgi:two-component system, OmpR family, sensor kinase
MMRPVSTSHKNRLAVVSSLTSSVILAAVFLGVILFAHRQALSRKSRELALSVAISNEYDPVFDVKEYREAYSEFSVSVFDASGKLLVQSGPIVGDPALIKGKSRRLGDSLMYGTVFRGEKIVVSASLRDLDHSLHQLEVILLALWIPLSLLVGIATWIAAQSVFRPLERLNQQAAEIGDSDFSRRLATPDQAEFGRFTAQLNAMLDRMEATLKREEQFASDAAHELRTPITILRTRIETMLLRPRKPSEYEQASQQMLGEIDRLTAIVEALLKSARSPELPLPAIPLEPIVREVTARWQERFADLDVRLDVKAENLWAKIGDSEITVVLDNLLDNASRFAPPGSEVLVSLGQVDFDGELAVQDAGPGIQPELANSVFERFVRGDDSRNRSSGGSGIGLSVCRKIMVARGGKIYLDPNINSGARFVARFPLETEIRATEFGEVQKPPARSMW